MQNTTDSPASPPNEPVRKPILITIGTALLLCVGLLVFRNREKKQSQAPADGTGTEQTQTQSPAARSSSAKSDEEPKAVETTGVRIETQPVTTPVPVPSVKRDVPAVENGPPRVEPSPATRQLVNSLAQLDLRQGPLTPEKAAEWKQNLQQLTSQGAGAVPAIREFLEKNLDLNYDATSGGLLGQPSLRLSFLEALQSI